jgi:hypothetical protein
MSGRPGGKKIPIATPSSVVNVHCWAMERTAR